MHKPYVHALQRQLQDLLVQNIPEVLQQLRQIFADNKDSQHDVILQLQRFNLAQSEFNKGILPVEPYKLELNRISSAILNLIDRITPEEAAAFELEEAIFKRILVVCKSAARENAMRDLFPLQYFKGVEFDVSEKPRPAESVNQFDLIIFDNFPLGDKDDPQELLRYYLDNTKPYLLYVGFGPQNPLLNQYPEKTYFANSVFSIHARLNEMIQYLKIKGNVKP